jgi:hypothetical protein
MEQELYDTIQEFDVVKYASAMEQFELRLLPDSYEKAILHINPGACMRAPKVPSLKDLY